MKKIIPVVVEWFGIFFGTIFIVAGVILSLYIIPIYGWSPSHILIKFFPPALLVNGIGIFRFKPWARKMALCIIFPYFIVWEPIFYLTILSEPPKELLLYFIGPFLFSILIISPILFYLTRPKVRSEFR